MSCEDSEVKSGAEEPKKPVDCYRAAREFERFMMDIYPGFRIGVDDRGDEHLAWEDLMERRSREVSQLIEPESFGKLIATITYYPDQQRMEIKRVGEDKNSEDKTQQD